MQQMRELFKYNPTKSAEVSQTEVPLEQSPIQNDSLEKAIAQERAEAIQALLQQQRDINKIVKVTASLVEEQGEEIDSIRNHITDTLENVQDGSLDVRKAEASKSTCSLF